MANVPAHMLVGRVVSVEQELTKSGRYGLLRLVLAYEDGRRITLARSSQRSPMVIRIEKGAAPVADAHAATDV